MSKQLIMEQWLDFERRTMSSQAPPIQRREMRRAFYAGAISVLHIAVDKIADADDDTGVQMLADMSKECNDFYDDIKAGRA